MIDYVQDAIERARLSRTGFQLYRWPEVAIVALRLGSETHRRLAAGDPRLEAAPVLIAAERYGMDSMGDDPDSFAGGWLKPRMGVPIIRRVAAADDAEAVARLRRWAGLPEVV